ncbi:MAG: hypothetical protein AAFS02_11985 [Pseudomonadota bacterium]
MRKNFFRAAIAVASSILCVGAVYAQCTAEQTPPPGSPGSEYDLNGEIEKAKATILGTAKISDLGPELTVLEDTARLMVTFAYFQTKSFGDCKNLSGAASCSQAFGNFQYGAIMHELGYSLAEAKHYAGIYQIYQNLAQNTDNPAYGDYGAAAEALQQALTQPPGSTDSAEDVPFVEGGYSYAEGPLTNDPNRDKNKNSCETDSNGNDGSSGSSTGGGGGGVIFSFGGGFFFGFSDCFGNCYGPGVVTVEDFPPPPPPPPPDPE